MFAQVKYDRLRFAATQTHFLTWSPSIELKCAGLTADVNDNEFCELNVMEELDGRVTGPEEIKAEGGGGRETA